MDDQHSKRWGGARTEGRVRRQLLGFLEDRDLDQTRGNHKIHQDWPVRPRGGVKT